MSTFSDEAVERPVNTILRALRRQGISEAEKASLRSEITDLWPELNQHFGDASYHIHVVDYIETEHRKLHNPRPDDDSRSKPLCGCSSPTCPLKRGELPADAKTRPESPLTTTSPEAAIRSTIQSHTKPHVLREAAEAWHDGLGQTIAELYELEAEAEQLLNKQRGTIHE